jgi:hypothetical protein
MRALVRKQISETLGSYSLPMKNIEKEDEPAPKGTAP